MVQKKLTRGAYWLPRFQAEIPVSVYINGKQVPPIEADGEITRITSTCLRIRCESKVPIPSRGIIRFAINGEKENLALNVDFVQRVEISKSIFLWKMKPKYEMQVTLQDNPSDVESKYKHFIHNLIFGAQTDGVNNDREFENEPG